MMQNRSMGDIESRPLTEEEREVREPLRVYPLSCVCGSRLFVVDWAMYTDLTGAVRIHCSDCSREVVPTEPMEFNA